MPVRRVVADDLVEADAGLVAFERGPIVFCVEGVDNGGDVFDMVVPDSAKLRSHFRPDLLGGVQVITGPATVYAAAKDGKAEAKKLEFQADPVLRLGQPRRRGNVRLAAADQGGHQAPPGPRQG